ncbi:hypothetical protein [Salinicoccus halitifaciens]|uniref:Uncharacterized protein n=1 Tax=Salinicoccus halitifaciens TaxID=1073415 RepID=A0ABV2E612_9STAP|nr:hypothetical protein [Salinicoccus halitifaciens]MCD2137189.1 hypothetical protein [Salinicoccus halitifaciens]
MNKEKYISKDAEMFIESLFVKQEVKDKTLSGSKLKFAGEQFRNKKGYEHDYRVFIFTHFLKFYKKYSRNFNYEEFIGVYSVALTEACAALGERFPDFRDFKYDKKVQMETMRYLKVVIENSLYRLNNPDSIQTKAKGKNVFVHADISSLDAIQDAYRKHDNEFELSDENRLFNLNIDEDKLYEFNYYIQHFLKNKSRILTKKQLDYYEKIKEVYVPKSSEVTKKEMLAEAGYTQSQHHKFMQNIAKRAETDFEKFGKKKAVNEDLRSNLYRVMNNFIKIADSDENLNNQQLNLTRIIQENYETEDFEIVILKDMNTEEKIHIVRAVKGQHYVSNKVLYKIYNNIHTYLEENEMIKVEPSEAKSTYSENILGESTGQSAHFFINAKGYVHATSFEDIIESEHDEVEYKEAL